MLTNYSLLASLQYARQPLTELDQKRTSLFKSLAEILKKTWIWVMKIWSYLIQIALCPLNSYPFYIYKTNHYLHNQDTFNLVVLYFLFDLKWNGISIPEIFYLLFPFNKFNLNTNQIHFNNFFQNSSPKIYNS